MRLAKKHNEALASALESEALKTVKETIVDDAVRGWSVFDVDGVEISSENMPETATAVCSNVIDLATNIGAELNETDEHPTLTFIKGMREMHAVSFETANLVVLRNKSSNASRENRNGH